VKRSYLQNVYQFFLAVEFVSEVSAKSAVETAFVAATVDQLVKQGAVVVGRIHEAGAGGHVDGIRTAPIISGCSVSLVRCTGVCPGCRETIKQRWTDGSGQIAPDGITYFPLGGPDSCTSRTSTFSGPSRPHFGQRNIPDVSARPSNSSRRVAVPQCLHT
jgi:hypothetical protein